MKPTAHGDVWVAGDLIRRTETLPWHAVHEALARVREAMQYLCAVTRPGYSSEFADTLVDNAIELFAARLALASRTDASVVREQLHRIDKDGASQLWTRIQIGMAEESTASVT